MASDCREQAVSEEYVDFIWQQNLSEEELDRFFPDICRQPINNFYTVFYVERDLLPPGEEAEYGFEVLPALYAPLQTESLEAGEHPASCRTSRCMELKGQGVLVGFIDTGIDYRNRCFQEAGGESRILAIWDQADQSGRTPEGIDYGTVYTRDDLNQALKSGRPYEIVPSRGSDRPWDEAGGYCGGKCRSGDGLYWGRASCGYRRGEAKTCEKVRKGLFYGARRSGSLPGG